MREAPKTNTNNKVKHISLMMVGGCVVELIRYIYG
jgi:hypothetical protein